MKLLTVQLIQVQDDVGQSAHGNTKWEPEGGPLCPDHTQFHSPSAWCFFPNRFLSEMSADLVGIAPDPQWPHFFCQEGQLHQRGQADETHRRVSQKILEQDESLQDPWCATGRGHMRASGHGNERSREQPRVVPVEVPVSTNVKDVQMKRVHSEQWSRKDREVNSCRRKEP